LQTILTNLVLSRSSGTKRHADAVTLLIFDGFCVYHTDLSGGEADWTGLYGRTVMARYDSVHTSQRLASISHGCGYVRPQILWEDLPTPLTHRLHNTAVNVRV
jgi:hypothetical protein